MPEFESVTLRDPSSSLTATFVPAAGMIGTSLADGDDEFLGPAPRTGRLRDERQDDGDPDPLPVGQPAERRRV